MNINTCKICNNRNGNKIFTAKEMMFGMGGAFDYLECGNCGCLQIVEVPADIEKYYPDNYYSFQEKKEIFRNGSLLQKIKFTLQNRLLDHHTGNRNLIGQVLAHTYESVFPWLYNGLLNKNASVLDVGCGSGGRILKMRAYGFKNVAGIDPFIKEDLHYPQNVTVKKRFLEEVDGSFNFIMFHHSFEHMENPARIFTETYRLLENDSYALIRIPVAGCYAWRKYGVNWVQLDAPRHFFLHTTQSMQILAKQAGLQLRKVVYDSTRFQFTGSEKYLRNIPLRPAQNIFDKHQEALFEENAAELNSMCDGDSACFYLYKSR